MGASPSVPTSTNRFHCLNGRQLAQDAVAPHLATLTCVRVRIQPLWPISSSERIEHQQAQICDLQAQLLSTSRRALQAHSHSEQQVPCRSGAFGPRLACASVMDAREPTLLSVSSLAPPSP